MCFRSEFSGNKLYQAIPSDHGPETAVNFPKMSYLAACAGCTFPQMQKNFRTIKGIMLIMAMMLINF
jgi:hypothetical protein